jgi:GTP-binding protein Era
MSDPDFPEGHRSGFVAVVGRPSVGKSTLVNTLLGQSIAPTSHRPQTTRRRQLGILTRADAQVIFVDTPGIHQPRDRLGRWMLDDASASLDDADVILVIFDLTRPPNREDEQVARAVRARAEPPPIVIALNKVDDVPADRLSDRRAAFLTLLPDCEAHFVSALRGDGRDELLERILALLPVGPRYYPADQVTDLFERDIAGELVRAAAMRLLRDEVPYGITTRVEEFRERGEEGAYVGVTLYVEREAHKPIVIGKGGVMLRRIGTEARKEIEAMSGRKVYLDLRVKVAAGWRDDEEALQQFGFRS